MSRDKHSSPMRIALAPLVIALALLAGACGSSDDSSDSTTTTAAKSSTTVAASTDPVGDAALLPLLLEPSEFGPGFVPADPTAAVPRDEYCPGVPWPTKWQSVATISVKSDDKAAPAGLSESVLRFAPGEAAKFIPGFTLVNMKCATATGGVDLTLEPLSGLGDEGVRGTSKSGLPLEVVMVRVGDDVITFVGVSSAPPPTITDELVATAIAKVQGG